MRLTRMGLFEGLLEAVKTDNVATTQKFIKLLDENKETWPSVYSCQNYDDTAEKQREKDAEVASEHECNKRSCDCRREIATAIRAAR